MNLKSHVKVCEEFEKYVYKYIQYIYIQKSNSLFEKERQKVKKVCQSLKK